MIIDERVSRHRVECFVCSVVVSHQQSIDGRVNGRSTSVAVDDAEAPTGRSCRTENSRESLRRADSVDNVTADGYDDGHRPHGTALTHDDKSENDKVR